MLVSTMLHKSNLRFSAVFVIDDNAHTELCKIKVGLNPERLVFNPTNPKLYAANTDSNTISVVDANNNVEIKQITVGTSPGG
ncbi:hypothetical protein U0X36_05415 [Bacillus thuringiensis]|uniref:YncE family protein n=1 Tax=Bacillus thuringiensis TaxID=1428 RepID=UPI0015F32B12|nr:hypothetical protein [Bacillus thuringiensis]MDZ3952383.1 hypothetical protein [Bacillus thuringiensis]